MSVEFNLLDIFSKNFLLSTSNILSVNYFIYSIHLNSYSNKIVNFWKFKWHNAKKRLISQIKLRKCYIIIVKLKESKYNSFL